MILYGYAKYVIKIIKKYVIKIIKKYVMSNYQVQRDKIHNAKEEIKELTRLLNEAKQRLAYGYYNIRDKTWGEWLWEWIGYY